MKRIISILLSTAIILQLFSSLVIVLGYEINKQYITQHFCINKNKPMMHCNGKCHMMKEMKKQEKKEQSPSSPTKEKQETVQFFQANLTFDFTDDESISTKSFLYFDYPSQNYLAAIFHPPTC